MAISIAYGKIGMMRGTRLREFVCEDLGAVKGLIDETIDASYSDYPDEFKQHMRDGHHSRERIMDEARKGYTIVLEHEGRLIGTGTLLGDAILGVFIHPSYQRKGFGRQIMRKLEERALSNGTTTIVLESTPISKRFYDSLGYVTLKEATFSIGDGQNNFRYYKMEKDIGLSSNYSTSPR